MIRALGLALSLALASCAQTATGEPATSAAIEAGPTIYVIRHLEKEAGDDPALTAEGQDNALLLANKLADKDVKAIFSTPYKRTMQTAQPLAEKLGIEVTPYDPREPAALVKSVQALGSNVLVVGHSNTVPDLIARLGGPTIPPIDEKTGYGTLYAVDAEGKLEQAGLN